MMMMGNLTTVILLTAAFGVVSFANGKTLKGSPATHTNTTATDEDDDEGSGEVQKREFTMAAAFAGAIIETGVGMAATNAADASKGSCKCFITNYSGKTMTYADRQNVGGTFQILPKNIPSGAKEAFYGERKWTYDWIPKVRFPKMWALYELDSKHWFHVAFKVARWNSNKIAVALADKDNREDYKYNNMMDSSNPSSLNMVRKTIEGPEAGIPLEMCHRGYCIKADMSNTDKAEVNIDVYPVYYDNLAGSIKAGMTDVDINKTVISAPENIAARRKAWNKFMLKEFKKELAKGRY